MNSGTLQLSWPCDKDLNVAGGASGGAPGCSWDPGREVKVSPASSSPYFNECFVAVLVPSPSGVALRLVPGIGVAQPLDALVGVFLL